MTDEEFKEVKGLLHCILIVVSIVLGMLISHFMNQ